MMGGGGGGGGGGFCCVQTIWPAQNKGNDASQRAPARAKHTKVITYGGKEIG